jgi:hypothetical protein
MRELLAPGPGRFYRGNVHCHSTRSDGRLEPAELVRTYRAAGYDFLAITDHFEERYGWPVTDTRALRSEDFTTLLGAELSSGDWSEPAACWIAALGLPPDFAPPPPGEHAEAIARAAAAGAYLCLLHPGLNGLRPADARTLPALAAVHAVEVYTHQSWIYRPDTAIAAPFLDALLEDGRRLGVLAADDAHFRDGELDAFGAWVEVHAAELTPAALLASLAAGTTYATQGPALQRLALDGDELHVACSPCARVLLTGPAGRWRRWRWRLAAPGAPLTEASFALDDFRGSFCRVTLLDAAGRRAWSNPIWP